jgi:hypothetical protein
MLSFKRKEKNKIIIIIIIIIIITRGKREGTHARVGQPSAPSQAGGCQPCPSAARLSVIFSA